MLIHTYIHSHIHHSCIQTQYIHTNTVQASFDDSILQLSLSASGSPYWTSPCFSFPLHRLYSMGGTFQCSKKWRCILSDGTPAAGFQCVGMVPCLDVIPVTSCFNGTSSPYLLMTNSLGGPGHAADLFSFFFDADWPKAWDRVVLMCTEGCFGRSWVVDTLLFCGMVSWLEALLLSPLNAISRWHPTRRGYGTDIVSFA